MTCFHASFMGLSYAENSFMHADVYGTGGKGFNIVCPIITINDSKPELDIQSDDNADIVVTVPYRHDIAYVMADSGYHKTAPVNMNKHSQDIRVVVGMYCGKIDETSSSTLQNETVVSSSTVNQNLPSPLPLRHFDQYYDEVEDEEKQEVLEDENEDKEEEMVIVEEVEGDNDDEKEKPDEAMNEQQPEQEEQQQKRDITWLQNHGVCMDTIQVGPSTQTYAGQGTFTQRFIPQGSIIIPTPLLVLKRDDLIFYNTIPKDSSTTSSSSSSYRVVLITANKNHNNKNDNNEKKNPPIMGIELLFNYCYGHEKSDLLLVPTAPGVNFINHHSDISKVNAKIQWPSIETLTKLFPTTKTTTTTATTMSSSSSNNHKNNNNSTSTPLMNESSSSLWWWLQQHPLDVLELSGKIIMEFRKTTTTDTTTATRRRRKSKRGGRQKLQ